ncbi:unnamed protein product [Rotaria sordida]|uniref:DUF4590 domain-containing protein n=1 Tax=Rotaria sordida TaxID=392033 RepID=A0A815PH75_9BILA|nr:unnamed protein product [Rotaria sordida]CAF1448874.1 unnamed protein product [Rotaria sordida]
MAETKKSKKLTHEQLEAILNTDHIWTHLINVGLINRRGDIIPKDEYKRRFKRRHTSNKKLYYPMVTSTIRHPKQNISNTKEQDRSQPPNYSSTDRRLKSASTTQSKQTNKTPLSTRFSSSNQSTWIENVRLRDAVSPVIMPADNRCFITMKYFGEEINIDYDRSLFIPQDDEIIVMQQHCGGENLIVFKGLLKPNDDFSFESRRHQDYPFALAFYINGVINNRLSVCCEYRCKDDMRIGGKRGLFAIRNIEKCAPCRRCRFEQRMKKLMEGEPKPKTRRNYYQKPNKSRTPSTSRETKSKLTSSRTASPQKKTSDISDPKSTQSNKTDSKISSSPISSPKSTESDQKDYSKTNGSPTSSPKPIETNHSKKIEFRTSSPESIKSDVSSLEERHESPSPTSGRPRTSPSHQPKPTSSPNLYAADFEGTDEETQSPPSTSRDNEKTRLPSSDTHNDLDHTSTVSSEKDDEESPTISDDSN